MTDLTDFLLARVAEDEQAARAAASGAWTYGDIDSVAGGTIYDPTVAIACVEWDNEPVDPRIRRTRLESQADATGVHIARHDPVRVLADCQARRQIIERYQHKAESMARYPNQGNANGLVALTEVLQLMAQSWRDHPDFDPAWAVDHTPTGGRP